MSEIKHILFIRHGECISNQDEIFQAGDQFETDPLSPGGEDQVEALAERFRNVPLEAVLCTSYLRGMQTARPIAAVSGAPLTVPTISDNGSVRDLDGSDPNLREHTSLLRELDLPSELAGLRFNDPVAKAIKDEIKVHLYEPEYHYYDEENLHDIWDRAGKVLDYLEKRPETFFAVVTHGGILKACLARMLLQKTESLSLQQKLEVYQSMNTPTWMDNTGVLSCRYDSETGWQWLLADVAHRQPEYFNFMHKAEQVEVTEKSDSAPGDLYESLETVDDH